MERYKNNEIENSVLMEKLYEVEQEKIQISGKYCILEEKTQQLQIELFDLQTSNKQLINEIKELITQISKFIECKVPCNEQCPKAQLCAKRILVVGGITKIKHLYRSLIESSGGRFEYHDGYVKNGRNKLEAKVNHSDVVLCPVNCNSHGACNKVKMLCKKFKTPVKMLPSASLSAMSYALFEGGNDSADYYNSQVTEIKKTLVKKNKSKKYQHNAICSRCAIR